MISFIQTNTGNNRAFVNVLNSIPSVTFDFSMSVF